MINYEERKYMAFSTYQDGTYTIGPYPVPFVVKTTMEPGGAIQEWIMKPEGVVDLTALNSSHNQAALTKVNTIHALEPGFANTPGVDFLGVYEVLTPDDRQNFGLPPTQQVPTAMQETYSFEPTLGTVQMRRWVRGHEHL